jgi:membrane protease YdiL (CAAX protease family)
MMIPALARRLPDRVAPFWHTAALMLLIVSVALVGTFTRTNAAPASRVSSVYLPTIVVQLGLVYYVSRAFRPRSVLADLVGRARLGDLAVAIALAAFVIGSELVFGHPSAQAQTILPRTGPERLIWIAVAASVGFAEELVYRGYFITQLRAFTGSVAVAIAFQAVLFGIAHANQGADAVVRFGIYAIIFGIVAVWRRSLVPTIVCHVGIDMIGAFH